MSFTEVSPHAANLLDSNIDMISFTLDKAYTEHLDHKTILPFDEDYNKAARISYNSNIRIMQVTRWVYERSEKIIDCFKNVLSVFSGSDKSLGLIIHRTPAQAEMFFVTQNTGEGRNEDSKNDIELLADTFRGNFPGSEISCIPSRETRDVVNKILDFDRFHSIACLSNIPSDKSEDYVSQGIDKLLNGIVPQTEEDAYTILILANSLPIEKIHQILTGYENLATILTPYVGYQFQHGENQTTTIGEMKTLTHSESVSTFISRTLSANIGVNFGLSAGRGASAGLGYSKSKGSSESSTKSLATGTSHSYSLGTTQNTTYTYQSYTIKNLIKKLEKSIERIQVAQANGLWCGASYILTKNAKSSKNIANFLRSLTQGDESFTEPSFIQEWSYESGNGITAFGEIQKYLSYFSHPVFRFERSIVLTPTAYVSTTELAKLFAFPKNSVQGLPVIECTRFGREPHFSGEEKSLLDIGCTYHMRNTEPLSRVLLDKAALTAHTFITGSTGVGKSNTVYTLLNKLCLEQPADTHFLVIEPAKGEYKEALGGYDSVSVYGTNPRKAHLLQLNPFSFPEDIHVLEHIDRLVEIFNACWPMYAAMPAVLKASVEQAYIGCGWGLNSSTCSRKQRIFPTFRDVMRALPTVVDSKGFSNDTQGDYKGALLTRLESLTNGINGQVFCANDELSDSELFDQNVIVDLSRVGSTETKSLLMGILILKLQEYRMFQRDNGDNRSNSDLKHITVLEEAHTLLRRTSMEQSQEGSNLQGKSVEMLTNAIAEMRTYGEGFIIADQAPGLLDMAVIRNTNTKIILRLPDEGDRMLVGKAAGLNDDQIVELSRLDTGVAAVYQNHWLEPVLCKISLFGNPKEFAYSRPSTGSVTLENYIFDMLLKNYPDDTLQETEPVDQIKIWIDRQETGREVKGILYQVLVERKPLSDHDKRYALYCLTHGKHIIEEARHCTVTPEEAGKSIEMQIMDSFSVSDRLAQKVRSMILLYAAEHIRNADEAQYHELRKMGGVQ